MRCGKRRRAERVSGLSAYWAWKRRIFPGLVHSQRRYRDVLLSHLKARPRWLDLGCGHQFTPDWAWTPDRESLADLPRLVGIDGDLPSIRRHPFLRGRVLGDIEALPFAPASFDLVSANMVMEHVREPGAVLKEIGRVLAPGGCFVFHTPNLAYPAVWISSFFPWRVKNGLIHFLEDRKEEDVYPTRYRINTLSKAARLGRAAGFRIERCDGVLSEAVTGRLGPLAALELLWLRALECEALAALRTDIIAVFRKP
jgi:SAM-dependent methyltransferase